MIAVLAGVVVAWFAFVGFALRAMRANHPPPRPTWHRRPHE